MRAPWSCTEARTRAVSAERPVEAFQEAPPAALAPRAADSARASTPLWPLLEAKTPSASSQSARRASPGPDHLLKCYMVKEGAGQDLMPLWVLPGCRVMCYGACDLNSVPPITTGLMLPGAQISRRH